MDLIKQSKCKINFLSKDEWMVNVLFITNILETGGAERYFVKCENRLTDLGINLFTAAKSGSFNQFLKYPDKYYELTGNHFKNILMFISIIKNKNINLLHANSFTMLLYCLLLKSLFPRTKLVYTKHNVTVIERHAPRLFSLIINVFVNKVITVFERQRHLLIEQGVQEIKTQRIYNGVDLDQFNYVEKENTKKRIGILGRLSPEKNHTLFLKVAKLIIKNDLDCTFIIAGDGPEKQNIKDLIIKLQLENHVELLGNINNPEVFFHSIDVMVLTSTTEAFPMTILESFAAGVPVVSINVGGINEAIINNETGVLINSYNAKEFATKIHNVLTNAEKAVKIKRAARQLVETNFNSRIMVAETRKVYIEQTL